MVALYHLYSQPSSQPFFFLWALDRVFFFFFSHILFYFFSHFEALFVCFSPNVQDCFFSPFFFQMYYSSSSIVFFFILKRCSCTFPQLSTPVFCCCAVFLLRCILFFFRVLKRCSCVFPQNVQVFNAVNLGQMFMLAVVVSGVWWQSDNVIDRAGTMFFISLIQSITGANVIFFFFTALPGNEGGFLFQC